MIEGYSVEEAATVLGVPEGRVWELLARGVLAGTPAEGGGMRVHLRGGPDAAGAGVPSPQAPQASPPANGNGHGNRSDRDGNPDPEASPFRELLTEFRNLTERYGQALLALGEARGEVAGLRARVEVLEARLDLRLPGPPGWPAPATREPGQPGGVPQGAEPLGSSEPPPPEPQAAAFEPGPPREPQLSAESPESAGEQPEPVEEKARRRHRRRGGSHSAVSGIAEALARAQDPSSAALPGGQEAAEALAELEREITHEPAPAPALVLEPHEPPVATASVPDVATREPEPMPAEIREDLEARETEPEAEGPSEPTANEAAPETPPEPVPGISSEWDEPDWIAEEDLDAMSSPAEIEPAPMAAPEPEAAAAVEIEPEPMAAPEPEAAAAVGIEPEPMAAPEPEAAAAVEIEPEPAWPAPIEDDELLLHEPDRLATGPSEAPAAEAVVIEALRTDLVEEFAAQGEAEAEAVDAEALEAEAVDAGVEAAVEAAGGMAGEETAASDAYEEELMWLGDEFRPSTSAWHGLAAQETTQAPAPAEPAVEDAELERLARQRGWDEDELSAIRSLLGAQPGGEPILGQDRPAADPEAASPPAPTSWSKAGPERASGAELPGAEELDEAMAALTGGPQPQAPALPPSAAGGETADHEPATSSDAASGATPTPEAVDADPSLQAASGGEQAPRHAASATEHAAHPDPRSFVRGSQPNGPAEDWLRSRRGPAASAYRRLRRLFPG